MAVEDPQHLPLGIGASVRGGVVDAGQNAPRLPVVDSTFHRNDALPHRRQHFLNREFVRDTAGEANALEPGARHYHRISLTDLSAIGQPTHFRVAWLPHLCVCDSSILDTIAFL